MAFLSPDAALIQPMRHHFLVAAPRRLLAGVLLVALAAAACSPGGGDSTGGTNGCRGLEKAANCGPAMPQFEPRPLPTPTTPAIVRIYVDRSGSMAGYLDRAFDDRYGVRAGSQSLRYVIDRVLAAADARERRVYGFGSRITGITAPSNQDVSKTLVRQDFYKDNDTRLEDVLDSVAADGQRTGLHLVVTDGRRGSGADAIAQYRRLGELARRWSTQASSLFAVAALNAPFEPVRNDKAGCWKEREATRGKRHEDEEEGEGDDDDREHGFRCPLYVFVFAPRTAAAPVLERLRQTGARLFVAPTPTDDRFVLEAEPGAKRATLTVRGGRAPGQSMHVLFASPATSSDKVPVEVRVRLDESVSRYALDDSLDVRLRSSTMGGASSAPGSWQSVRDPSKAWIRPGTPRADDDHDIVVPVELRAHKQVPPTRYTLDVLSTGYPGWLGDFEAPQQGHATRTYGLGTLFGQLDPRPATLATVTFSIYPP